MAAKKALIAAVLALLVFGAGGSARVQAPASFAARVEQLSEIGGYFDTDNLISNERSYLHVLPALREAGVMGGAYVGVGPDQNFSYIAHIRPDIVFIVDIRRDNLLLHLLFKALFAAADTRIEYVCLLFGRPVPATVGEWRDAGIARMLDYIDQTPRAGPTDGADRLVATLGTFGVPLSADDLAKIQRFHRTFVEAGPSLKFNSYGRVPRDIYPTYRELLAITDPAGREGSYLATEEYFNVVRSLQQRDMVIPVVGDLAGETALAAIGRVMSERGDRLSAFYVSNVESYLFNDGRFPRFVDNLSKLPRNGRSVLIRAMFGGSDSTSFVQTVDELVEGYARGRFRSYYELMLPRTQPN